MDIGKIAERNAKRQAKFAALLQNNAPIEEIRNEAIDDVQARIKETEEIIDFAFGVELQTACIRQQRYNEKLDMIRAATTSEEIVRLVG